MTSAAEPPSYVDHHTLERAPTYRAEPHIDEARIAFGLRNRTLPTGNFIKESKGGGVILRLNAQKDNVEVPVYGINGQVDGVIELLKTEAVESVEVKIEGHLSVKELGEGGSSTALLCLDSRKLWEKSSQSSTCPASLRFSLGLPASFEHEKKTYPLPPSFHVKLSGLPGFVATIDYSVSAIVVKPQTAPVGHVKIQAHFNTIGINIGTTIVSTPFLYHPRSRSAVALPAPLQYVHKEFEPTSEWKTIESVMQSRSTSRPDIVTKLYIPSSRTYCISQQIPFHLTIQSKSSVSLAAFLPYSPTGNKSSKKITQIQLLRQTSVDVNSQRPGVEDHAHPKSARTDMWRIDCIGEGIFRHVGDDQTWICYSGEIRIDPTMKLTGFRAAALSVKDSLLFTITPPEVTRSPFWELREAIPIRLTTDPWTPDDNNIAGEKESILESGTPPDNS
ncbi:hypothetical protein CPB83DRAFT_845820 [Crepidotus variabilis]|uniref:Uncharacterized protein n=1 Tax=Crepidotus variabilis TaxID=179855 RepID=A0A9P6EPW3_9AGAR|nr:hypothetical protein CPB83DRAFT_845820 [Crepidotus variabilis]